MLTCPIGSVSVSSHDWFKDNAFDVAPLIKLILYFVYSQCWLQEASAYRPGGVQQSPEEKRSEWFQWFRRASKPGDCLQTSQSFWCTSDRRAWSWSWLWMSQTLPCSRMTGHVPGPLEPEEEGRQCQFSWSQDLGHTWLRTLSSIAASCSTNKVSWRVKLCSGCWVSFELSEFSAAAASSFQTCTLDSLLSGLLGGVFIAPGSGLLAPALFCSSQLEAWAVCAAPRAKGTAPGFPTGLEQEGGLLSPATIIIGSASLKVSKQDKITLISTVQTQGASFYRTQVYFFWMFIHHSS